MSNQSDGDISRRSFLMGIAIAPVIASGLIARATAAEIRGPVVVLYPDVGAPYQTVFKQMLSGIQSRVDVRAHALSGESDNRELKSWLDVAAPGVVIALGRRVVQQLLQLGVNVPVVAGAILSLPEAAQAQHDLRITGISLSSDPNVIFAKLNALAPRVNRVFVVYNPGINEWIVRRAQAVADTYGLRISAYAASDLGAAMRQYKGIFELWAGATDSLWLPVDPVTVDDNTVLPLVLENAWDKKIAVISSSPEHAAKGVLFSLYPDNEALGRRLAEMALRQVSAAALPNGLVALTDLAIAVNIRTAAHLRMEFSRDQMRGFNLVFPAR